MRPPRVPSTHPPTSETPPPSAEPSAAPGPARRTRTRRPRAGAVTVVAPRAERRSLALADASLLDATTPPSTPTPAPAPAPVLPRALDLRVEPASITAALEAAVSSTAGARGGWDAFEERVAAEELSLISGFERLLSLEGLPGFEPLPHQVEAVRRALRVHRGRALLCDEVGLGKTVEAGLVAREVHLRGLARRILVLAPPALVGQWQEELANKLSLSFATTRDPAFRDDPRAFLERAPLVVASLALARTKANAALFLERSYDLVIVDEAHHLKRPGTAGHELVSSLEKRFLLLLTATPVENDLFELYTLITLLKPGQLGTPLEFKRRFVARGQGTVPREEEALRGLLREVMVRNTRAASGVVLPRRRSETIVVEPCAEERELYAAVTAFVAAQAAEAAAGRKALAAIVLRTLQSEAGSSSQALAGTLEGLLAGDAGRILLARARRAGTTRKEARLLEILRGAAEPAVVFTKHRATLAALAAALRGAGVPFAAYHGGLTGPEKDRQIEAFRTGAARVLLTTQSGGEGRNLQFCRLLVNYDLPWNPMQIEQRIGRLHRIGQTREVIVLSLACAGTIEDHILRVLEGKLRMFELVVGEMDLVLGRLQDDRDFEALVLDLFLSAPGEAERAAAFDGLGERLLDARRGYEAVRALDERLFGEDFNT